MSEVIENNPMNIHMNSYLQVPQKISYEEYFEGTKQLTNNFEDSELEIKDYVRTFSSVNKNGGYDEVFSNNEQKLFGGISAQISFLYPHNIRDYTNRIGFRYYKENPLLTNKNIQYFTLVNIGLRKFKILEKELTVKDEKGESFSINNLDCLDIMMSIIKNRIAEDKDFMTFPNTIAELLGFIYAAKITHNDNLIILDPYYPSLLIPETMIENYEPDSSKYFIEPILYNNHVSLLLFYHRKFYGKSVLRYNILFDMSGNHYKSIINEDPIFTKLISINIKKFPSNSIQMESSCSIWFYSTLLFLMNSEKIKMPPDNDMLLEIINKAYELMNITQNDINYEKNGESELESVDMSKLISLNVSLRTFIKAAGIMKQFFSVPFVEPDYIEKYQKDLLNLRKKINLYKLNKIYYSNLFGKEIFTKDFIKNCIINLSIAEEIVKNLIYEQKNKFNYLRGRDKSKNYKVIGDTIKDLEKAFEVLIPRFEYKGNKIYNREDMHKFYFDNSDIFLKIMDN